MAEAVFYARRARAILDAADIDVLLACRPENFSYVSGVTRREDPISITERAAVGLFARPMTALPSPARLHWEQ